MAISKKRPCKICRRWFRPKGHTGESQKTCGNSYCKAEWHRKKCREWNKKNSEYFKGIYIENKLKDIRNRSKIQANQSIPSLNLRLPRQEIQEVIGLEGLIVIEYILHLFFRRFQEARKGKVVENTRDIVTVSDKTCRSL